MMECLKSIGLEDVVPDEDIILVTDSWKGTTAAVKQIKDDNDWDDDDLRFELVNHSKGEIVNMNGYTTNQIEARWSVLKRWIRKRNDGRLPAGKDREGWKLILLEFQWRKRMQFVNNVDQSNTRRFPTLFFQAVAQNRS